MSSLQAISSTQLNSMAKFDETWIANRFRYRKTLTGSRLVLDEETGYMQSPDRRCFTAEQRKTFIDRFKICANAAQIARSIPIDIQSVYDAIAVDQKFRNDFLAADKIPGRSKQLNDELKKLATSEKSRILTDLSNKLDKYK